MVLFLGDVLIEHILKVFDEYGLTEQEVKENVYVISDRGPNIKSGLIKHGFKRMTCYAHLIHNLVGTMLEDTEVNEIIKKCSKLTAYMKNTGLNAQLKTSLKLWVSTRWNSVYMMIDSILVNYNDIHDILTKKQRVLDMYNRKHSKPVVIIMELLTNLDVGENVSGIS